MRIDLSPGIGHILSGICVLPVQPADRFLRLAKRLVKPGLDEGKVLPFIREL